MSAMHDDEDGSSPISLTGCGYMDNYSGDWREKYKQVCVIGNANNVVASTTNNAYGIYDMSGGADEYVSANYASYPGSVNNEYTRDIVPISKIPNGKYIDVFPANLFPDNSSDDHINYCTWQYCGGQALHETIFQSSEWGTSINLNNSYSGLRFSKKNSWIIRGGRADHSNGGYHPNDVGIFVSASLYGVYYYGLSSRAALTVVN